MQTTRHGLVSSLDNRKEELWIQARFVAQLQEPGGRSCWAREGGPVCVWHVGLGKDDTGGPGKEEKLSSQTRAPKVWGMSTILFLFFTNCRFVFVFLCMQEATHTCSTRAVHAPIAIRETTNVGHAPHIDLHWWQNTEKDVQFLSHFSQAKLNRNWLGCWLSTTFIRDGEAVRKTRVDTENYLLANNTSTSWCTKWPTRQPVIWGSNDGILTHRHTTNYYYPQAATRWTFSQGLGCLHGVVASRQPQPWSWFVVRIHFDADLLPVEWREQASSLIICSALFYFWPCFLNTGTGHCVADSLWVQHLL